MGQATAGDLPWEDFFGAILASSWTYPRNGVKQFVEVDRLVDFDILIGRGLR